jgi:hypothetical protein
MNCPVVLPTACGPCGIAALLAQAGKTIAPHDIEKRGRKANIKPE